MGGVGGGGVRSIRGGLLLRLGHRVQVGHRLEVGRHLLRLDGLDVCGNLGVLLGLRVRGQLQIEPDRTVRCGLVVPLGGRGRRSTARRHEEERWKDSDGHRRRECNADPHGTSLRRAHHGCARLCSVWAGSGLLHSRPERRAGRRRPFWLIAAGCAAGCAALGWSWVCRPQFLDPDGPAHRRAEAVSVSACQWVLHVFLLQPEPLLHGMHQKEPTGFRVTQCSSWVLLACIHPRRGL